MLQAMDGFEEIHNHLDNFLHKCGKGAFEPGVYFKTNITIFISTHYQH